MPSTSIKTSQIKDDAVTFDKIENASAESILIGRGAGNGGGNYQAITVGSGLSISGTTLSSAGGVSDGDKGDISVSGSGTTWTIDSSAVTNSKIANNTITGSKISSSAEIALSKLATQSASKLVGTSEYDGTVTAITLGTGLTMTGSTLSASGGGGGAATQKAFKAADETTNTTNNIYSNDTDLSITVAVSGWYSIEIFVATTIAANGVYFGITGVGGWAKLSNSTTNDIGDLANITVGSVGFGAGTNFSKINGMVNCSGGENIRLAYYKQFGGNVTCHAGSYMKIEKAN